MEAVAVELCINVAKEGCPSEISEALYILGNDCLPVNKECSIPLSSFQNYTQHLCVKYYHKDENTMVSLIVLIPLQKQHHLFRRLVVGN